MQTLLAALRDTLADEHVSRSERRALKQLIRDAAPDKHQRAWLRRQIFDLAQEALKDHRDAAVLGWLEDANKLLTDPAPVSANHKVYFSPGETCLAAILSHIRSATQSLYICVFTITDNRIASALIDAHRFGVEVRILTDNDKSYDAGSDIDRLAEAGIAVRMDRTHHHMHHKFAVVDARIALTGSYNWTRSAADHNYENLLITDAPEIVDAYHEAFKELWKKMG